LHKVLVNIIPRAEQEKATAFTIFKLFLPASIIGFSSWLAEKRPELDRLYTGPRPPATLLALPFSYARLAAVPLSLPFFIPFLLASRLQWNFWWLYLSGIVLLAAGYSRTGG